MAEAAVEAASLDAAGHVDLEEPFEGAHSEDAPVNSPMQGASHKPKSFQTGGNTTCMTEWAADVP